MTLLPHWPHGTQDEAREDLHRLLTEHELWDAPLLVLANKQDEPRAASTSEITEHLQLFSLSSRNWYIIDTKATHPLGQQKAQHDRKTDDQNYSQVFRLCPTL